MKVSKKDEKKAREYALMYLIKGIKTKNPKWKPNSFYKLEAKRFVDGIISAGEFIEFNKVEQ
jgi:hypothetical protein